MRKDFFEEFCRDFAKEVNRLRIEQRAGLTRAKRELERVKREIQKVIDAIVDGVKSSEVKDRMTELQDREEVLLKKIETANEPPPSPMRSGAYLDSATAFTAGHVMMDISHGSSSKSPSSVRNTGTCGE